MFGEDLMRGFWFLLSILMVGSIIIGAVGCLFVSWLLGHLSLGWT